MAAAEALASEAPTATRGFRFPQALPNLSGPWRKLFLVLWLLVLPAAVVAPLAGSFIVHQNSAVPVWQPVGLVVSTARERRIEHLTSQESRASGLKRGDIVVAIDGRQVPSGSSALVRSWMEGREGAPVVLTVRSGDGSTREVRLTRRASHEVEYHEGTGVGAQTVLSLRLIPSLAANLGLVAASILLFRRRRDTMAAILSLSLLLIAATLFNAFDFWRAYEMTGLGDWAGDAGWCGLMLVLLTFPSGRFDPRWTFLPAMFLLLWWPLCAQDLVPATVENLGFVALLALGVAALAFRYRRLPAGAEQQQLRWVFLGFGVGTILLGSGVLIFTAMDMLAQIDRRWLVWGLVLLYPLGALGVVSYAAGLIVSMLRYRLYDADQVISRSAGYAVLTLLLGATFAASAKGMEVFFESYFGREAGALPGAIGAGLAVVLITPMHNRIHRWAERRFQQALLHLRRDLPLCVGDLRETAGLSQLLDAVLARIGTGVRASRSAALLPDGDGLRIAAARDVDRAAAEEWLRSWTPAPNESGLDCSSRDSLFPMRVALTVDTGAAPEMIGWILLGPRPDGSFYGKDEQEALAEIADPVARAVQIVLRREEREAKQEARFAAVEAALGLLKAAPHRRTAKRAGPAPT